MLYLIAGAIAVYALYSLFTDTQEDRPPSRSRRPRSPSPPRLSRRRDGRQHRQTIVVDSSYENYPPVETHACLRAKAKKEGDLMAQCYRQSQEAYERRDRAFAKTLSDQGKRHALKMENLNAQASAIIFKGENRIPNLLDEPAKTYPENNQDRPACEIDLHGLYVKEAITYSEEALKKARQRGDPEIRLIVGQGNHSDGGVSRLKPAIQEAMQIRGVRVEVDPKNPGVLRLVI